MRDTGKREIQIGESAVAVVVIDARDAVRAQETIDVGVGRAVAGAEDGDGLALAALGDRVDLVEVLQVGRIVRQPLRRDTDEWSIGRIVQPGLTSANGHHRVATPWSGRAPGAIGDPGGRAADRGDLRRKSELLLSERAGAAGPDGEHSGFLILARLS